jgi:hypothetical protein
MRDGTVEIAMKEENETEIYLGCIDERQRIIEIPGGHLF